MHLVGQHEVVALAGFKKFELKVAHLNQKLKKNKHLNLKLSFITGYRMSIYQTLNLWRILK